MHYRHQFAARLFAFAILKYSSALVCLSPFFPGDPACLAHRFERLKAKDNDFEVRFAHLGNLGVRNGVTEFNWDSNIDDMPSNEHH